MSLLHKASNYLTGRDIADAYLFEQQFILGYIEGPARQRHIKEVEDSRRLHTRFSKFYTALSLATAGYSVACPKQATAGLIGFIAVETARFLTRHLEKRKLKDMRREHGDIIFDAQFREDKPEQPKKRMRPSCNSKKEPYRQSFTIPRLENIQINPLGTYDEDKDDPDPEENWKRGTD